VAQLFSLGIIERHENYQHQNCGRSDSPDSRFGYFVHRLAMVVLRRDWLGFSFEFMFAASYSPQDIRRLVYSSYALDCLPQFLGLVFIAWGCETAGRGSYQRMACVQH
jgi:hypothetical protein